MILQAFNLGFHSFLIAGVSLEALCNTSAPPPDAVLVLCLKSLYALLAPTAASASASASAASEESAPSEASSQASTEPKTRQKRSTSWAARVLVEERVLCVELVHVLYRVLLARNSSALHLLALETLVCLLRALRHQIREQRDDAQTNSRNGITSGLYHSRKLINTF